MRASKILTTAVASATIVGAIGFAYAQTSDTSSTAQGAPQSEQMQNPTAAPADSSQAPGATTPSMSSTPSSTSSDTSSTPSSSSATMPSDSGTAPATSTNEPAPKADRN